MLHNFIPLTFITMFPSQLMDLAGNKAWNNFGIFDFVIKSCDVGVAGGALLGVQVLLHE